MLTSEAWSGSATQVPTQPPPGLSYRDRALMVGVLAAVLATATVVLIAVDAGLRDRIPDPVPTGTGLAALASFGASLALWARSSIDVALGAMARRGERFISAVGELAAEQEQTSARVAALPSREDLAEAVAAELSKRLEEAVRDLVDQRMREPKALQDGHADDSAWRAYLAGVYDRPEKKDGSDPQVN